MVDIFRMRSMACLPALEPADEQGLLPGPSNAGGSGPEQSELLAISQSKEMHRHKQHRRRRTTRTSKENDPKSRKK